MKLKVESKEVRARKTLSRVLGMISGDIESLRIVNALCVSNYANLCTVSVHVTAGHNGQLKWMLFECVGRDRSFTRQYLSRG